MTSQKKKISPEILIPRIGEYLVQKKFISLSDLNQALYQQLERAKAGDEQLLGKILIELNLINQETLDEVITDQLIQLRDALEQSNRLLEQKVEQRTIELQKALKKLNELNELKTNFVSNISHELRTPLTHIKGYLDLMIANDLGPLSQDQMQVLEIMVKAADRLEKLIEDLIMFTHTDHEEINISRTKFDLLNVINEISNRFKHSNAQVKIEILNETRGHAPLVFADQKKISWVIIQLVENAIKFSKDDPSIFISIKDDLEKIQVSIIDNGIGISTGRLQEIFEPFHQLDSSSTRKAGGVGLGLALAKKIVESHGSELIVDSQIGIGSKFEFSLEKLIQ